MGATSTLACSEQSRFFSCTYEHSAPEMNNAQLNLSSSLLQQVSVPLLTEALLTMPSLESQLLKAARARTPGFLCLTATSSPTSSLGLAFAHWLQDLLDKGFSHFRGQSVRILWRLVKMDC